MSDVTGEKREEKTKADFRADLIVKARVRTWEALNAIASRLTPGISEAKGIEIAGHVLRELGAEKNWHRSYVRFGVNSTLPYGVASRPGIELQKHDIFFLDLGPVWEGYEGDCGNTFVVGNDPEMLRCADDCREIYRRVSEHWRKTGATGAELYHFAAAEASARGWELNAAKAGGHRISDFPHAVYFRGNLAEREYRPTPGLWILEIQIRHPTREFGAFFEDLLV